MSYMTTAGIIERLERREEWRTIEDWPYEVSDIGNIRNQITKRILIPAVMCGYHRVTLSRRGERKYAFVHRLVHCAFVGPIGDGLQINHIDGKKLNNAPSNLECVTAAQNIAHAIMMGLSPRGDKHGMRTCPESVLRGERGTLAKLKNRDVRKIRKLRAKGETFAAIAKVYGVHPTNIWQIVARKTWAHI